MYASIVSRIFREPVMVAAAIRSVILASVAFGVGMSAEQVTALMLAVETVLAVITRAMVTPNEPKPEA